MILFLLAILLVVTGCDNTIVRDDGEQLDTVMVVSRIHYLDGREPQLLLETMPNDWCARLFDDRTKVVYKEGK